MQICNHPSYIAILEHIAYLMIFKLKKLHQFKLGLLFSWLPHFFQSHTRSYQNKVQHECLKRTASLPPNFGSRFKPNNSHPSWFLVLNINRILAKSLLEPNFWKIDRVDLITSSALYDQAMSSVFSFSVVSVFSKLTTGKTGSPYSR